MCHFCHTATVIGYGSTSVSINGNLMGKDLKNISTKVNRGFSLLEVMVVALLVAILGTMTTNVLSNWLARRLLDSDVQQINQILRQAQALSVSQGVFTSFKIDQHTVTFVAAYGNASVSTLGPYSANDTLDIDPSTQIFSRFTDTPTSTNIVFSNRGRLLTGQTRFRLCSTDIQGETPIEFNIYLTGQVETAPRRNVRACP